MPRKLKMYEDKQFKADIDNVIDLSGQLTSTLERLLTSGSAYDKQFKSILNHTCNANKEIKEFCENWIEAKDAWKEKVANICTEKYNKKQNNDSGPKPPPTLFSRAIPDKERAVIKGGEYLFKPSTFSCKICEHPVNNDDHYLYRYCWHSYIASKYVHASCYIKYRLNFWGALWGLPLESDFAADLCVGIICKETGAPYHRSNPAIDTHFKERLKHYAELYGKPMSQDGLAEIMYAVQLEALGILKGVCPSKHALVRESEIRSTRLKGIH